MSIVNVKTEVPSILLDKAIILSSSGGRCKAPAYLSRIPAMRRDELTLRGFAPAPMAVYNPSKILGGRIVGLTKCPTALWIVL